MFRFEHMELLWGLAATPLFIALFIWLKIWQRRSIKAFGDESMVLQLMPDNSTTKAALKWVLFGIAYTFLIIGIANPQYGSKPEEVKQQGIDLMIALDLSNSMKAEDLKPNRLENAKRAIAQLIDRLHSDRIGIVVFGGQAYVQLPITTDYGAAKLFLNTINTDIIPTQGTAIGAAIDLSMEAFDFESPTSKAIVVITDGENHEDDAIEAAKKAAEKGVVVHTIGMGSAQGGPIPIYRGSQFIGFAKDKQGATVTTQLNEGMLQDIAGAGKGVYIRAGNDRSWLANLTDELSAMKKTTFSTKVYTDYEDHFQYYLAIAVLFLLLEMLLSTRKSKLLAALNLFETKTNA